MKSFLPLVLLGTCHHDHILKFAPPRLAPIYWLQHQGHFGAYSSVCVVCTVYIYCTMYCTLYSTVILYRIKRITIFSRQKKTELARYEEFFFHNKLWYMWYYTVYTWGILQNRSRISHPAIVNNIRNCVLYGTHCKNNKQIYLKIGVCNGS